MSFNELNSVEHYIIQKLSGVNLNAADASSSVVKEDATPYGSFPWQYRSAEALNRPTDQVLLEGELREALIRINPEITVLVHGGPVSSPEDANFMMKNTTNCHGFYGASSMERLPTEIALTEQTRKFKAIRGRG